MLILTVGRPPTCPGQLIRGIVTNSGSGAATARPPKSGRRAKRLMSRRMGAEDGRGNVSVAIARQAPAPCRRGSKMAQAVPFSR